MYTVAMLLLRSEECNYLMNRCYVVVSSFNFFFVLLCISNNFFLFSQINLFTDLPHCKYNVALFVDNFLNFSAIHIWDKTCAISSSKEHYLQDHLSVYPVVSFVSRITQILLIGSSTKNLMCFDPT